MVRVMETAVARPRGRSNSRLVGILLIGAAVVQRDRELAALTGATQMDDAYIVDVGKMQFRVGYRYVRRLRDVTDPECAYEETCFYPVHKGMPKAEEIATALLQLTNNPALFDKWAVQNGLAFKADGQVFTRAE